MRAQLRAEVSDRLQRSSNAGGPAKRRKSGVTSLTEQKKRKGGKASIKSSVTSFEDMPDEMLLRIADFLTASDGTYLFNGRKLIESDIDWDRHKFLGQSVPEHEREKFIDLARVRYSLKKLSAPAPFPVASLRGVAILLRSLAFTSKRMCEFAAFFIENVLIDADLFGVPVHHGLGCLLWLLRRKPRLSRLRGSISNEAHLLAMLLALCDTSELRACDVKFSGTSFIRAAWLSKFHSKIIDLASEENSMLSGLSLNEMLSDLEIPRTEYIHANMTEEDFYTIVAAECKSLEILSITMKFDPYENDLDSRYAAVMSSKLLKYIDLNISCNIPYHVRYRLSHEEPRQMPAILYSGMTKAISKTPNLRGLRLGPTPYIDDKYGFEINSDSLELIDTVDISKNTFVLKCKCPSLQHFLCNAESFIPRACCQQDLT